jgi:hypothetical protein
MTSERCWYCNSDRISEIAWRDLLPQIPTIDTILIFDGAKPISRMLTFCEACGEWLASSSERKQVDELIAALRLVTAVPELAGSRLEHSDKPDIHVHLGGKIYGLEVTRIARGGIDAMSRAKWRGVVQRSARLLSRARDNPPVWVTVRWNPDPPGTNAQTLAGQLVYLVEQHIAMLPLIHSWTEIVGHQIPDELAPYVHGLHVVRTREDDQWVSGFSLLHDVPPEELQDEINRKALKTSGYKPPKDGLWLLIYAEAANAAQALDLTDEAQAASYTGPFDRVFYLDSTNRAADLRLPPGTRS